MTENQSRVVVITGASGGIGAALARHLGGAGHRVVLAARREAELERVAGDIGGETLPVVTDVTRRADVERLRDRALEHFGRVDVWVNNAGRGITRSVLDLTDEDVDEMMAINVKSALYGMQAIAPHFVERGNGHLINVSSLLGRVPLANHRSAYNAAKAALNALTANLRVDLRAHPGVHVTLVMPGLVSTGFNTHALGGAAQQPPPGAVAVGVQTPEEVAAVIAGVIEQPVPEVYTNPSTIAMVRSYYEDVGAFEAASGAPR